MKRALLFLTMVLMAWMLNAQAPEKMTYQAVVRDNNNHLIVNTNVGVRVSVLLNSPDGAAVYRETHTVQTNVHGLVTLAIGDGISELGDFAGIAWADGTYFLKTEIDPDGGSNYTIEGVQQLMSVPYALYAKNAGNGFSGNYNDLTNKPTIPTVPDNVSAFTNDAGYITSAAVPTNVSAFNNDANYITSAAIPTNVSAFNNDAGYLTSFTESQILSINNDTIFLTGGSFVKLPAGFDGDYNSLTNKPNLATVATSGSYGDLSNTPNLAAVATSGSYSDLSNTPNLATVATSGSYNDLINKPTIPAAANDATLTIQKNGTNVGTFSANASANKSINITVPTTTGELTNNSGFITSADVPTQVSQLNNDANYITSAAIPTNVSAFNNDAGYLTSFTESQILRINNDTIFLTGGSFVKLPAGFDGDYNSLTNIPNLATVATSGSYGDLSNTPNLATVATSGSYSDLSNTPNLATVATSGSYNDLTNKPTIPAAANDATLTIQKNGTNVGIFSANASANESINITVPTTTGELTNNSGFITSADVPTQVSQLNNDANYITSAAIPANVSAFSNDAGYLTSFTESQILRISNDTIYLTGGSFVKLPAGFDGDYNSLTNKPNLATVATSGSYSDLSNKPTLFDGDYNSLTNTPNLATVATSGSYSDLNNTPNLSTVATSGSYNDLNNTPNLSTVATSGSYNDLNNTPNLSIVATSGSYNDLTNKPTIPAAANDATLTIQKNGTEVGTFSANASANESINITVPTTTGELTNNSGFITSADVPTNVSQLNNDANYITSAAIPTNVSAFNNDAGYLTSFTESQILRISNDTIYLTGGSFVKLPAGFDGDYNSLTNKPNLATVATSGSYNDLSSTPNLATVATSGSYSDLSNTPNLATVAISGNYNDLTNTPTIPAAANDATLTIQKNGTEVGTFSANASANENINITVPTTTGDLTNNSGFITSADVPTQVSQLNNDANYITSAAIPTNVSAFNNDAGYLTSFTESQILRISNDTIYLTGGSFVKLPAGFDGDYNSLTNTPNLSTVATSGSYNDLDNTPNLSTVATSGSYNDLDNTPNLSTVATSGSYSDLSNTPNLAAVATSGSYSDLSNTPNLAAVATSGSYSDLSNTPNLATVAISGSYNDLTNKPTIPAAANDATLTIQKNGTDVGTFSANASANENINITVPTTTGELTNNSGFITSADVPTNVSQLNNDANYITSADVPTNVSAFNNDANYITSAAIPTNVSAFNNDAGYLTSFTESQILRISNDTIYLTGGSFVKLPAGFDGDYNSLTNTPNLSTVATSGSYSDLTNTPNLATVATSGSYNDLTNKPTIPAAANNGTLCIQRNGTNVGTFSANASANKSINIAVPTTTSELTNNSGFITSAAIPTNVSAFTNDAGYLTQATVQEAANIPTRVSAFTNDAGYITAAQVPAQVNADWNATSGASKIVNKPNLATVATSGSYNDLTNKPTIFDGNYNSLSNKPTLFSGSYNDLTNKPTIPAAANDATLTIQRNGTNVGTFSANASANKSINIAVPTTTSELTNNSGFITSAAIPTNVSAFTNDAGYLTQATVQEAANIPTQVSAFTNDAGYITAAQVPAQVNADWNATSGASKIVNKPNLATVATSGSYNDLTNKPTIPAAANDATLTIQKNGTNVGTFSANASANKSINIAVPTTTSELTNNSGFITSTAIPTNVSAFTNDAGYLTSFTESQILRISNDTIYLTGGSFVKLPAGFDGDYNSLTNTPNLATVATSGSYNDLTDKPAGGGSGLYFLTFDANTGAGSMNAQIFPVGIAQSVMYNGFTKAGHTFAGWNTSAAGTGTGYTEGQSATLTENTLVYAQWTVNHYSVNFHNNGGTGDMAAQDFTYGVPQALTSCTMSKTGYHFDGWNTASDGTGTGYTDQQSISASQNLDLYAQWAPDSYTVRFIANNGTDDTTYQTFYRDRPQNLSANGFSYAGHNFADWTTAADGTGTGYSDQQTLTLTADLTLYARWTTIPTFRVTFNANGGTGTMADQIFLQGVAQALDSNRFTRTGCTFVGWNTNANGLGVFYTDRQEVTLSATTTLYAKWDGSGLVNDTTPTYCNVTSKRSNETGTETRISAVRDHQMNSYRVVQIGAQCWLKENMRATTSPSTGTNILQYPAQNTSYTGKRAYYPKDSVSIAARMGVLYNWNAAVDTFNTTYGETSYGTNSGNAVSVSTAWSTNRRGICPEGWHVPNSNEWNTMLNAAGVTSTSGAGKLAGGSEWAVYTPHSDDDGDQPGNQGYAYRNQSGFSAVPAGLYNGNYNDFGGYAYYVSAAQYNSNNASYRYLYSYYAGVYGYYNTKSTGYSVRCLRD